MAKFNIEVELDWMDEEAYSMVKWSNEEPWLIEDLKKLEVVEEYE